ncbi:hypothetical protein [Actinomadura soli]|uniref:hypothetical protein n=1 Tax=Actinomadura soli TaxID=2508997 RepID=UPI001E48B6FB|nr:hypothetical protein [Actinomadura soli]
MNDPVAQEKRMLFVSALFPPRSSLGAESSTTTSLAPACNAAIPAQRPAFPAPTTRTCHSVRSALWLRMTVLDQIHFSAREFLIAGGALE